MALPLNPMGLNGPNATPPVQQPNTANPTPNSAVASSPVGADEQNLQQPITRFVQPGIAPAGPF